jgi:hypothetical protein
MRVFESCANYLLMNFNAHAHLPHTCDAAAMTWARVRCEV